MRVPFASKGRVMYAVVGTCGGICGLFDSKWKAIQGLQLWNLRKPSIKKVWIQLKKECTYEVTEYKRKIIRK